MFQILSQKSKWCLPSILNTTSLYLGGPFFCGHAVGRSNPGCQIVESSATEEVTTGLPLEDQDETKVILENKQTRLIEQKQSSKTCLGCTN